MTQFWNDLKMFLLVGAIGFAMGIAVGIVLAVIGGVGLAVLTGR